MGAQAEDMRVQAEEIFSPSQLWEHKLKISVMGALFLEFSALPLEISKAIFVLKFRRVCLSFLAYNVCLIQNIAIDVYNFYSECYYEFE